MYWQVDATCYFLGIISFIYFLQEPTASNWMGLLSLLWFWIYPLLLEGILNLFSKYCLKFTSFTVHSNAKIVYHPKYNISLCGMEKYHSFDAGKFRRIFEQLQQKIGGNYLQPEQANRSFLLERMSCRYLLKLCYGFYILRLVELPFWFMPAWILRWRILQPMQLATSGSIMAACIALKHKWAVNLSGGFHHASFDRGGGFCIYPDISLTVHYLQSRHGIKRIMIIDLDAHQGNGYERDFVLEESVYIVDCYNYRIYPNDGDVKEAIIKNLPIQRSTSDKEYLRLVGSIANDFQYFNPEFVIYNAGTDILIEDPLGSLSMSAQTVIRRDQLVTEMCLQHGVPMIMLLSGGYHERCADVIAESLGNLLQKFSCKNKGET